MEHGLDKQVVNVSGAKYMGMDCWILQSPKVLGQFVEVIAGDMGYPEFT